MSSKVDFKYFAIILASTLLQGSSFVSSKILLHSMQPLWLASIRFFLAALSLLPWVLYLQHRQQIRLRDLPWKALSMIGALQTAGVMIFLNLGLVYSSASMSAIIMASNPVLVVILVFVLFREKTSALGLFGLLLAFVGVVICLGLNFQHLQLGKGEVLVMLASTCWALSTILSKKFNLHISHWLVTFYQMLIGSLMIALVALCRHVPLTLPVTVQDWWVLLWLVIPASTGAIGLWFLALKLGGSVHTSGYLFLCPFFSGLISFVLYGIQPSSQELLGGVLIAIGIFILANFKDRPLGTRYAKT